MAKCCEGLRKQRVGDSPVRLLGFFELRHRLRVGRVYGVDPDLPLGALSRTTVPDALEPQVGYAESASPRQKSGLLRRRFWIRYALWGCRVRLTPKGTPERGGLKNGRFSNAIRPY